MALATDIRIVQARSTTRTLAYRTPIKFGGRVVTSATLVDVAVDVVTRAGERATGYGSMPMGNVWSWPSATLTPEQTLAALVRLSTEMATPIVDAHEAGHPLEICQRWHPLREACARRVMRDLDLGESIPILAQLVATSPWEAAAFDAFGRVHHANAFNLLGKAWIANDLSPWLGEDFSDKYLDAYTSRSPQSRMPIYHLVGALDPLTKTDVAQPVNDGLPETLGEWIAQAQLTHLQLKLNGDDLRWDVDRVLAVNAVAEHAMSQPSDNVWRYSLDFNERCRDVEYVLEFLRRIQEGSPRAYDRVQYIEQPTHRDLKAHPELRMHAAADLKPVVIDESLVDLESLYLCRELGYSGIALKACKGHSEALLMGAAAQQLGLFLCVQDLTCPGASFLHSAAIAARIPTVAAIEGNGRQYCPAGNRGWDQRYPTMFRVAAGTIDTGVLHEDGLGFDTQPLID